MDLFALIAALTTTLALTPLVRWIAGRAAIVDCPDGRRKLQKQPVPLLGGVAVLVGWWTGVAILRLAVPGVVLPSVALPATVSLLLLATIGGLDDAFRLRARWKLLGQSLAVLPIVFSGCQLERLSLGDHSLELGMLSAPATIFWLILGINSLNLLDGMDGMATVVSTGIALTLAAVGFVSGQHEITIIMLPLVGALLGFLPYNFPAARIYLGDVGSMVLGLSVALSSLLAAKSGGTTTNLTALLAIMAIPMVDTTLAIVRRSLSGRGFWHPDREHIHHRLLDQGLVAKQVLLLVVPLATLWGIIVVAAAAWQVQWPIWATAVVAGIFSVQFHLAGQHEWTMLTRWIHRSPIANFTLPSNAQLLEMPFDAAWQGLLGRMRPLPVINVRLTIEGSRGLVSERVWTSGEMVPARSVVEVQSLSRQQYRCLIRVESTELALGAAWSRLPNILDHFAQFWAEHPETIDTAVLPFDATDGSATWLRPATGGREHKQKQAA
jgi:UDP-GlcNAc:undecaprenyl-phosphate/decaprenyl-phosphate GlcNAc-1-phosphate transferase